MSHYFSEKQTSKPKLKKISAVHRGRKFEFYTASGVFSKSKVDKGTELLVNSMQIKENSDVLDLGCGIGIVGIAAASLFKANILMIDINDRALELAKSNLKLNNVNAEVRKSNLYANIKEEFEAIIVNPPMKAGKRICYEIIEKATMHLKDKGSLQLVARHNKGGKDLSSKMKEVFGNVKTISKKSGYMVYMAVKE